jgi:hypothetical protein
VRQSTRGTFELPCGREGRRRYLTPFLKIPIEAIKSSPALVHHERTQPLICPASLWTIGEGEITANIFGVLIAPASTIVAPVEAEAMPVVLTKPQEGEIWNRPPARRGECAAPAPLQMVCQ